MRYYLGTDGDLISLALAREDGHAALYLYGSCPEPDLWVRANVIPFMRVAGAIPALVGAHPLFLCSADHHTRRGAHTLRHLLPSSIAQQDTKGGEG